jgi:ubiquinone/menaquinone biosynthesis C-methylase UbiE
MATVNVQNEKEFHNKIFESQQRTELQEYYSFTNYVYSFFYDSIKSSITSDSVVLEYGCGINTYINSLAAVTSHRYAFDISDFAIEQNRRLFPGTDYKVADAHNLDYPDNFFDVVFGASILHHLDLSLALKEIYRIVKPGGTIIFLEPMGHNYFINRFRNKTPEHRTPDEHPLLDTDIKNIKKYFSLNRTKYYCLFPLGVFALFRKSAPSWLYKIARSLDKFFFKLFPILRKYSWIIVVNGAKK